MYLTLGYVDDEIEDISKALNQKKGDSDLMRDPVFLRFVTDIAKKLDINSPGL